MLKKTSDIMFHKKNTMRVWS